MPRPDLPRICAWILHTEARDIGLLARLHLLFNPADTGALPRMLLRQACGIGAATLQKIGTESQPCGLRLTDLTQRRSHHDGDPFHALLHALGHGTVVVFDVAFHLAMILKTHSPCLPFGTPEISG